MNNEKLPTHYSTQNNLIFFWKEDQLFKMQEIENVCIKIDKDDKEAKCIKSVNYRQDFDLFNAVEMARDNKYLQFMTSYQFGKLLKSYVDNFAESIEQCDKIRSAIDNIFDRFTRFFFYKQIAVFACYFVVPFLAHMFVIQEGTSNKVLLCIILFGWACMYSLELIAMRVEGLKTYITNPWNMID